MKALMVIAAALCLAAHAAEIDNPACGLLTEDEVRAALGESARESEINREMTGASDCGWVGESMKIAVVSRARGLAFQGDATAADGYRALQAQYAPDGMLEDLEGLGEAAFFFTPTGAMPGTHYALGFLRQGNVVILTVKGATRSGLMRLGALAAGRVS